MWPGNLPAIISSLKNDGSVLLKCWKSTTNKNKLKFRSSCKVSMPIHIIPMKILKVVVLAAEAVSNYQYLGEKVTLVEEVITLTKVFSSMEAPIIPLKYKTLYPWNMVKVTGVSKVQKTRNYLPLPLRKTTVLMLLSRWSFMKPSTVNLCQNNKQI